MYYVFLGHQPSLSVLELQTVIGVTPVRVTDEIYSVPEDTTLLKMADKLGGTTKIARAIESVEQGQVLTKLQELMIANTGKNVAISNFTPVPVSQKEIRELKVAVAASHPIRFVSFDDRGHELIMIGKQHVTEFNLIPENGLVTIAETVWIFDGLGFALRDRKKPYQDIKRGMIPVKIARIMVNLAVKGDYSMLVLDPFCGTGTILGEALMVGNKIVGADLDHLAVSGTETNLAWLSSHYNQKSIIYKLYVADATQIDKHVESVGAVVTEPLMGPLLDARRPISQDKVRNIAKGLDKLYRGALRTWHGMLPVGGRVVITIPTFEIDKHSIPTILVDTIEALGYNYVLSVPYSKPDATVVRNITILEKK